MYVHKYYFKLIKDEKEILLEFHILIPVEGNEKAIDSVKHSILYANAYLKTKNMNTLGEYQYRTEYLGTSNCDDFQEAKIKTDNYSIIPINNSEK